MINYRFVGYKVIKLRDLQYLAHVLIHVCTFLQIHIFIHNCFTPVNCHLIPVLLKMYFYRVSGLKKIEYMKDKLDAEISQCEFSKRYGMW